MKHAAKLVLGFLFALVVIVGTNTISHAQEAGMVNRLSYYVAPDANNISQVYQLLLDNMSEPRQITQAKSDVITFGVSYDGLAIAYMSESALWLQPIHTESAERLADVTTAQYFTSPVFSQDGQYIAYADNGLWLLDLSTRETRQLLADVQLTANTDSTSEYRRYEPVQFVLGKDGKAAKLILRIGVWEWVTSGVYDLVTGELLELEGQNYNHLLPLDSGFVLLYGNGGVAGDFSISIAPSLNQINEGVKVLDFADITDQTLFAEQAVEIAPDVVRIYGQSISETGSEFKTFSFDYNLVSGASEVNFITIAEPSQRSAIYGQLSPDGTLLPIYVNPIYRDFGTIVGSLHLLDITTGEKLTTDFPANIGIFRWQQ